MAEPTSTYRTQIATYLVDLCVSCSEKTLPLTFVELRPLTLGGGGRLRVLREKATRDAVLGSELLRRVHQCRCHDERGRGPDVLLPGKPNPPPAVAHPLA